ncbi:MAG TPA: MFS transporter [bacterium]
MDSNAGQQEPRYGWVMVAITPLFVGLATGGIEVSVFLKPIGQELGWLRGQTAFGYLIGTLALGMGGILMGYLADKYSTRRVVTVGVLVLATGYLALSQQHALWQFYGSYVLLGGFGAAAIFAPMMANVGGWFSKRRGLAIGLTTAGQALAQGGVPYVSALIIAGFGWRSAYAVLGITSLVVLLPLTLLIKQPPKAAVGAKAGSQEYLMVPALPSLALLSAAAVFCCITMASPLVHVVALSSDAGLSSEAAARVLLVLMISGIFGRITFGRLADTVGPLRTYLLCSFWQTALVFWFTRLATPGQFYLMAAVWGFGFAGVMTGLLLCAQRFAPPSRTGIATGVVTFFGWIGMGVGGFQAGAFYDMTGNYVQSYANAAMAGTINLSILIALYIYRSRRMAMATPALKAA